MTSQEQLEPDSKHSARIVVVRKDDVFVELGSREQGVVSLQQFATPPVVGGIVDVVVQRFNTEDGLYELALPGSAVHVEDWSRFERRRNCRDPDNRPQRRRAGMRSEPHPRLHSHQPGHFVSRRGFVGIRRPALHMPGDRGRSGSAQSGAQPPRHIRARKGRSQGKTARRSLQPGQIHDGVVRKIMAFRRVCRHRRRRRPAARQPTGLGPGKTSQRGRKRRPDKSAFASKKSILKPAKSASHIAICWKVPGPRYHKNIRPIPWSTAPL